MNSIDSFPPADMPLRAVLPNFSPTTRARLIAWGEQQPGSLPWLIGRAAAYWDKFHAPDGPVSDEHHMALDATASLDLLRHRIQCPGDRDAVDYINTALEKEK